MEIFITAVSFLLFFGLILSPILLLRRINKSKIKFKFITYLIIGLILTAIIVLIFAWWADTSDLILLRHYGYNIDGMNETEFYGKVSPENMDKVNSLVTSISGIGWPVKAFLMFIFYSPYLLVVYFLNYLSHKLKLKRNIKIHTDNN